MRLKKLGLSLTLALKQDLPDLSPIGVGGLMIVEHKLEPLELLKHLTSLSIHARLYAERTDYRGKDSDNNLNNLLDC